MNLMVRKFCLLDDISCSAVMGCSSNTMLTVHSEPEGAELTTRRHRCSVGESARPALVFSSSDLENALQSNDCYLVRGIEAIWQSGATLSMWRPFELCGSAQRNFEIVLQRPAAAPDLEQDIEYAKSMRLSDIERHRLGTAAPNPVLSSTNTQQTESSHHSLRGLNRPAALSK